MKCEDYIMDRFKLKIKPTKDLSASELIKIMQARVAVFVVEQDCPYQEIDTKDENAWHVILKDQQNNQIAAYARIVDHDDGQSISFGRVLVVKSYRNQQLGRAIVTAALDHIHEKFPDQTVKIAAQDYLRNFYGSLGFKAKSDVYLEDGIPHIDMTLVN